MVDDRLIELLKARHLWQLDRPLMIASVSSMVEGSVPYD